jgi:hypothetical protein
MDRATTLCFFKPHEMGLQPKNVMSSNVEVLSPMLPAQSASL